MPTQPSKLAEFFRNLIPTRIVTRHDPRSVVPALAHTISVDDVHDFLRQAEGGNPEKLFALYRDIMLAHSHLQGRFADRKRAVLGDTLNLIPFDKKSPVDRLATDAIWPMTRHVDWVPALNHLLDATLWPVAVLEKVYRAARTPGLTYELARLIPVPHDLLDFRTGRLRIKDTDEAGRPLASTHDPDPARYIVHRGHLLTTADHWGGPFRSLVFWWLLATQDREWWARFLDRYGAPFTVGKYPTGDDDSRSVLERAFSLATKLGGLVVTSDTDVEIKQAAASDTGAAFQAFHDICNREISKLILGQTLSSDAQATGLGSGVANTQDGVRQDIRQFDALLLGATLSAQLATQFLAINGLHGSAPIFTWGAISVAEQKSLADVLTSLNTAGLRLTDSGIEALSERLGLSLERVIAPAAPSPFMPFSVRTHSAIGVQESDEAIARTAAADLVHSLGKHHAPIVQIVLRAKNQREALAGVEAYCAALNTGDAARVIEEVMIAYAANGATARAV